MTAERWQKIKAALEHLRELPPIHRDPEIAKLVGSDAAMEREVRELLTAHDESEKFLQNPAIASPEAARNIIDQLWSGKILGRYRIVRHIGDGGMGSVFEAERADGEFQQQVAIKIVRRGLETAQLLERFRKERQILAELTHPNIARLIDGGTTEEGLPYLVMEYVRGTAIDTYCEQHHLDTAARLRLVHSLCLAVEHAHSRRVIHRDIKPGNIVVNEDGLPKLLDFGIARIVSDDGNSTSTSSRLATPNYASPEQVRGETATARSDVYSLGVTLYELLAGRHPFQTPGRTPHDIAVAICEREPEPLPGVPADLQRIVRQAMAKDPAARYPTAQDLAGDILRYLQGSAVQARPARRNTPFVLKGAVAFLLVAIAAFAGWRALRKTTHSIAVVHVENLTRNAELDWFDRGLSELLTTNLAMVNGFEVVSTERVRNVIRRINKDENIGSSQALDVARQAQVDWFITGALLQTASGLRLDLRVLETASGKVLFADKYEGSEARAVFAMADQAAANIVARLGASAPSSAPDAARVMTSNVEALRLYEEARRLFDRFQYTLAYTKLNRALELDPDFAMAYYLRSAMDGGWRIRAARDNIALAAGKARQRNLPRLQQNFIRQAQLLLDGRNDEANALGEQIHREFPRETEPLILIATAQLRDWNFPAVAKAAQEVVRLDPREPNSALAASIAYGVQGDAAAADTWTERYCDLIDPGDWNCDDLRGDVHILTGRLREAIPLYRRNAGKNLQGHIKPAITYMLLEEFPKAAELVDDAMVTAPKLGNLKPITEFVRGNLAASQGNWNSALEYYESSARAYFNLEFRFDQLWKIAEYYFETGQPQKALDLAARHETPWLPAIRAVAHHLLKNPAAEEAEWTTLRASLTPVLGDYMAVRFERLYRLIAHSYAGEHDRVLEILPTVPIQYRLNYALPAGRAFLAKGNFDQARSNLELAWAARLYYGGPQMYEEHRTLRHLLARYYLGRLAAAQGHKDLARDHYRYFLRHLDKGNPILPQVQQARNELGS